MTASAPGFPIWDLADSDLPRTIPDGYASRQGQMEETHVYRGAMLGQGDGPGVVVVSYDPSLLVNRNDRAWVGKQSLSYRGPLSIAGELTGMLVPLIAEHQGLSVPEVASRLGLDFAKNFSVSDTVMCCSGVYLPALSVDVGLPDATVTVSANLLTHAVAVATWQHPLRPWPQLQLAETSVEGPQSL